MSDVPPTQKKAPPPPLRGRALSLGEPQARLEKEGEGLAVDRRFLPAAESGCAGDTAGTFSQFISASGVPRHSRQSSPAEPGSETDWYRYARARPSPFRPKPLGGFA